MDISQIPLFSMLSRRMAWLGERQELLTQNVANADTPGYTPRDLTDDRFKQMLRSLSRPVRMETTHESHIMAGGATANTMSRAQDPDFKPMEQTMPDPSGANGNSVVIEDELAKVSETAADYQLVTTLYRRHVGMIRMALGRGGGS